MMKKLVAVALASAVVVAFAEEVKWKAAVSGDWSVGGNWDKSHPPTLADKLVFVSGTYTIHNDTGGDLTLLGMGSNVTGVRSLDLGGHRLTITSTGTIGNYANTNKDGMRFLNGVLDCSSGAYPLLGANGAGGNGLWWISTNATYIGWTKSSGSSRILVDGGGCWQLTQDQQFPNATMTLAVSNIRYSDGSIVVTGVGSSLKSNDPEAKRQIQMQGYGCRFEVSDGATAELKNLYLKTSPYSNTTVTVNNGLVTVDVYMTIGYDDPLLPCDHRLQITGDLGRLEVGSNLNIIDDSGNQLVFAPGLRGYVDASGNPRAALYAKKLTLTDRAAGNAHFEKTKLIVDPHLVASDTAQTVKLIEVGTANKAALQALADNVQYVNYAPQDYASQPSVTVADDGLSLKLKAPVKKSATPPTIEFVSSRAGDEEGSDVITLRVVSFGSQSTSATLSCRYRLEDESAWQTKDLGVVSGSLPLTYEFVLEGLRQHRTYSCQLIAANDECQESAQTEFSFVEKAGYEEEFNQVAVGDFTWSDPAAWENLSLDEGVHDGTYPFYEDLVHITELKNTDKGLTRTITFTADAGAAMINTKITGDDARYVFDLNGHTYTQRKEPLTATGSSQPWAYFNASCPTKLALETCPSEIVIKGPGVFDTSESVGARFGNTGSGQAGAIRVTDGAIFKGKPFAWNNGSRIIAEKGGQWIMTDSLNMDGGAASTKKFALIAATGEGSRVSGTGIPGKAYTLTVTQPTSALWVADGATAELGSFSMAVSGDESTTNTLCIVDDAEFNVLSTLTIGHKTNASHDSTVRISGRRAKLTVGKELKVYSNVGAKLEFIVPTDGWAAAPFVAQKMTIATDRTATAYEPIKVRLDVRDWCRAHPKESVEFFRLKDNTATDKEAIQTLKSNIEFIDVSPARAETLSQCVWISEDGLALGITAPASNRKGLMFLLY